MVSDRPAQTPPAVEQTEPVAQHAAFGSASVRQWFTEAWDTWRISMQGRLPDVIRYLYLMRFSLLLWLSMLLLAWADTFTGAASITRGILTPFSRWQWFFTGLAVVLPGWFALLAARIVCAYGEDRFGIVPPPIFQIEDRMEWFVFWGAQIPGVALLLRIAYNSVHEGEGSYAKVWLCLSAGAVTALAFWYIVSILYYWIWDPDSTIPVRAFLVPKWRLVPLDEIQDIPCGASLRLFSHSLDRLCRLGPGYRTAAAGQPHHDRTGPGHVVACITLLGALLLYFLLMPISAPVPVPGVAWPNRIISSLLAIYLVIEFIWPAWKGFRNRESSPHPDLHRAHVLPLLSALIMILLVSLGIWSPHAPRLIPVIAYVVVLLIVVFWTMAGVAFFADHYRVPVLTLATAFILALNHWPAEHVFPARHLNSALATAQLPDPKAYVQRIAFNNGKEDQPVVIVTATGGGIHAAAWTATTLRALDKAFSANGLKLNNHLLLMSGVSGGSVATAGFLREYFTQNAFDDASFDRIQAGASCSSLQGVAWGLAYPDTIRLLLPFVFNAFPYLDRFDRGWALQKAIDRNLRDRYCIADPVTRNAAGPSLSDLTLDSLARLDPRSRLCTQYADACAHFPAFTLNSTVVETGDRFLLSNYSVFSRAGILGTHKVLPAASFLGVYGRETILPLPHPVPIPDRGGFADISLLTAARLSATFTYVSPAARLPFEDAQRTFGNAYHFVDGGYYDNDGTNSAIEFLKAASPVFSSGHPLRVLLVEIRNASDIDNNDSPDSYGFQAGLSWSEEKHDWVKPSTGHRQRFGPLEQLMAPPEAATHAGFGSTTARNRRELDTLLTALCGSLELKHVVLDYTGEKRIRPGTEQVLEGESELNQPLSWHLTRRQLDWISGPNLLDGKPDYALHRKKPKGTQYAIQEAVGWFQQELAKKSQPLDAAAACQAAAALQ